MSGKKYSVTEELTNIYPDWARIREDETTVGYQLLNAVAGPMDRMSKELVRYRKNTYLTTANLDEVDITNRVVLPKTFEFEVDNTDPLLTVNLYPVVSGEDNGQWYQISGTDDNSLKSFWYDSVPTRGEIDLWVSGVEDVLLEISALDASLVSGEFRHHLADTELNGGRIWIETIGGVQYLDTNDDKQIMRGRVKLTGKTRKTSLETETLIFPWDMKQPTLKEWEFLTKVEVYDIESGVDVIVRSSDVVAGPYLSPWNLRYSKHRRKIDEFWDIDNEDSIQTVARIGYTTDEWEQLVLGFSNKETKRRWELLKSPYGVMDDTDNHIEPVDMAIQPFSDSTWFVTEDAQLYLYDLQEQIPSGLNLLIGTTPESHVHIAMEWPDGVKGETFEFVPWHVRAVKDIREYTITLTKPDGTDELLAFDTLQEGEEMTRTVGTQLSFELEQRGTYLLTFDVTFVDDEVQTYKAIVPVNYKLPLCHIDLSEQIIDTVEGVEFDSDQRLWVKTTLNDFYRVKLHYDVMLLDFDKKIVYLKDNYSVVHVGE